MTSRAGATFFLERLYYRVAGLGGFALFGCLCLIFLVIWPLQLVMSRKGERRTRHARWWMLLGFRALLGFLRVMGVLHVDVVDERRSRVEPRVIVGNHLTLLDIVILISHFPEAFTFVKRSMARHPLLRTIIEANHLVAIDPLDIDDRLAAFDAAMELVAAGKTMIIFPEGTRSRTGALLPFNKGAFKVAVKCGVPVTPVVITTDAPFLNGKGVVGFLSSRVRYTVRICPDIPAPPSRSATPRELRSFRDEVYAFFVSALGADLGGKV